MAGRLTLWGAGELLSAFWGRVAEPPANFYLALIRDVAPTSYVSGGEIDEPPTGDYARAVIENTTVWWSNESQPQVMLTDEDVLFTEATEDWGVVRYWALCNADAEGFVYAVGELDAPYNVEAGDVVVVGAGDLAIALGPFFTEEG